MNARRSWTLLALMGVPLMCVAGTSLGEEALSSASLSETSPTARSSISAEVPDKPLPTQKRPPCMERGAATINGGCWLPLGEEAGLAPCDAAFYEHKGRCYIPILIKGAQFQVSSAIAASPGIIRRCDACCCRDRARVGNALHSFSA